MKIDEKDIIANFKSKWLVFEISERKPKTVVIQVGNNFDGSALGIISWYSRWRCYAFEPDGFTIYEKKCLRDIANLLEQLTENQRSK